jgi:hypothetical protein
MTSKRKRMTAKQLHELRTYVLEYRRRGVMGVWWDHMLNIEAALREIDDRRASDTRLKSRGR